MAGLRMVAMVAIVLAVVLGPGAARGRADVIGPELVMRVNGSNEQVVLNDGQLEYDFSGSAKGLYIKDLTLNPHTGTVYVLVNDSGSKSHGGVIGFDPTATSTPSSPGSVGSATVVRIGLDPDTDSTQSGFGEPAEGGLEFPGAVKGTSTRTVEIGNVPNLAFNPNWSKGTSQGSLVHALGGGDKGKFEEYVPQTASVNYGELEEGSVGSEVTDAGEFGYFKPFTPGGTAAGSSAAIAYLDRRDDGGGTEMDRWLYVATTTSSVSPGSLYVIRSGTGFTTAPTNDTRGTRSSNSQGFFVDLDGAGIISGTSLQDMAVRPGTSGDEFDIYFLSIHDGITKLDAIRATIPTSGAMSYETIDLDPDSANDWVQLTDSVADADIVGRGIVFSADASVLYVSSTLNLSTGHGGSAGTDDARVYIFDEVASAAPIPEPASVGLLGLALLGLRRRRG